MEDDNTNIPTWDELELSEAAKEWYRGAITITTTTYTTDTTSGPIFDPSKYNTPRQKYSDYKISLDHHMGTLFNISIFPLKDEKGRTYKDATVVPVDFPLDMLPL